METPVDIVTVRQFGLYLLATALGVGGSQWFTAWKSRKNPQSAIYLSEKQADLAIAQAAQTLAETIRTISAEQKEAKTLTAELAEKLDEKQYELDNLKLQANRVPVLEAEVSSLYEQNSRIKSLCDANGWLIPTDILILTKKG